jgi:hypothetical protein
LQLNDELGGDALYLPLSCYMKRLAVTVEHDPGNGNLTPLMKTMLETRLARALAIST